MLILLGIDEKEICWQTLVSFEHPLCPNALVNNSALFFLYSHGGILSGILICFKSYLPVIILGLSPAAIYVLYENITPVLLPKLFSFR